LKTKTLAVRKIRIFMPVVYVCASIKWYQVSFSVVLKSFVVVVVFHAFLYRRLLQPSLLIWICCLSMFSALSKPGRWLQRAVEACTKTQQVIWEKLTWRAIAAVLPLWQSVYSVQ